MQSRAHTLKAPSIRTYDRGLLAAMLLLIAFGALMIYSSTSVITPVLARRNISEFYYFKRHFFTMILGFLVFFVSYRINPGFLKKAAVPMLICSFVLLLMVFLPHIGVTAGGARRWIRLWPTTFQPSELVKLSMVIFLARYLSMPGYNPESFYSFIRPLIVMAAFQVVFLKQPDFGSTMSLAFLTFAMLFISGMRMRYIASVMVLAIPVVYRLVMEPYRLRRVTSFLDPWKDPLASGFQLVQSFIALGSGGITGLGLGESKQKLAFLPASHTDFIVCMVGEELGLVGVSVLISLFVFLFSRGIAISNRSQDKFLCYLSYGLTLMISLQALINFAVVTGLVPTKGLPLPFLSYGGSALLVNMAAVGIMLRISRGDETVPAHEDRAAKVRRVARRNIYGSRGVQA